MCTMLKETILYTSCLLGQNEPNFEDGAKCFDRISTLRNSYINSQQKLQNHDLSKDVSLKYSVYNVTNHLRKCDQYISFTVFG